MPAINMRACRERNSIKPPAKSDVLPLVRLMVPSSTTQQPPLALAAIACCVFEASGNHGLRGPRSFFLLTPVEWSMHRLQYS
jgi:hypothetical protein